jgi:hypothetical protein
MILDLASHINGSEELSTSLGAGVLPDRGYFDTALSGLASFQPHPSLSVQDPLVPAETQSGKSRHIFSFDRHGLSAYARAALALQQGYSYYLPFFHKIWENSTLLLGWMRTGEIN